MTYETKKYTTGFTSGALLYKEAIFAVDSIQDVKAFLLGKEGLDADILPINSEGSRKRIKIELEKRLQALNDYELIELFKIHDETNRKLILFYAACKLYALLADFMLEVVLYKWNNIDLEISNDDFQNFLYKKMALHDELLKLSEISRYKLSQVALKMLKQLGMIDKGQLKKKVFNESVLKAILKNGDTWFLKTLFLKDHELKELT
ncbi:BrxA family protein [Maribacter arcticus]|uniref:Putative inner membrane protein n=1 Tax=Maribacter arcticus TaxID=561365 RepID=A0A1T5AJ12_9FLAO|nr:BrxA family protein [Maribacter arcticus]SKB34946.1 Putative inner membrane protein [Maribacter arcticus]